MLLSPMMAAGSLAGQPPHAKAYGHDKAKSKDKDKNKHKAEKSWDRRFQGLDDNGNGVISRGEWNGDGRSFSVHDWNRDGVLSGNELRAGALPPPRPRSGERDEVLFARMDANDDGRVTRNEWTGTPTTFNRLDFNDDGWLSAYEYGVGR
jgi:Ca2+-binding EF-hand superfamily protein